MLTLRQSQEFNRFQKLLGFFTSNSTIIATFTPFQVEVTKYMMNFQSLNALVPDKDVVTTGITSGKDMLKQKIADALALVCKKTKSYAMLNNLPQLAATANSRADKIVRMKDSDILGFATSIQTAITAVLADPAFAPYNITAAMLTAIVRDSTTFNGMIGRAESTASTGTIANTSINNLIKTMHVNISHCDLLIGEFESNNTAFVQGYHINSSLDTTGIHHSGIEGIITAKATGLPLVNASITVNAIDKIEKTAATDLNGAYNIDRISTGDYVISVSAPGFTTQTVAHHIVRGKIDEMDFAL